MRAAKRLGTHPLIPTPADNDLFVSYSWPGNARELSSVIERAAILGNGRRLEVAKALGYANTAQPRPTAATAQPTASSPAPNHPQELLSLDAAMARHMETALAQTQGRIEGSAGAAQLLKINPHTLRARMRKLNIDWKSYREG